MYHAERRVHEPWLKIPSCLVLQIAKALESTLNRHRPDTLASDWCLVDGDPIVFAITVIYQQNISKLIYIQYIRFSFVCTIKWQHFPRYLPFVRGIHRSPVNSRHKGQWRGALMFPWICAWINGWANNRGAGDLRRHRAHYDGIMVLFCLCNIAILRGSLRCIYPYSSRLLHHWHCGHMRAPAPVK